MSYEDVLVLCNALGEVVHTIEDFEFFALMGAERGEVGGLQNSMQELFDQMKGKREER